MFAQCTEGAYSTPNQDFGVHGVGRWMEVDFRKASLKMYTWTELGRLRES